MGGRAVGMTRIVVMAALLAGAPAALAVGAPTVDHGAAAANPAHTAEPDWMRALRIRSEALNRRYGLGGDEWLRALRLRSEELNRSAHGCALSGLRATCG
jgi:hypothetical protein